jgi:low affinity Fe/Cu permease
MIRDMNPETSGGQQNSNKQIIAVAVLDISFQQVANSVAKWAGSKWAFLFSIILVVGWLATGPIFNYSDSWSLFINTITTIVTFCMVFLIQATQNRETKALSVKLDELIRATDKAKNEVISLESKTDVEIEQIAEVIKEAADETVPS